MFWDVGRVEIEDSFSSSFSVLIRGWLRGAASNWVITGVHGLCESNLSQSFFEESGRIKDAWVGPCCLGGDFNKVREPGDRR